VRLPRDIGADDLIRGLRRYGYEVIRRTGSHVRLTTTVNGEHHVTIPGHNVLRVGTLQAILKDIARHLDRDWQVLMQELFADR
jgi:predicted RNA binding protein YcfA (HicA-like mRNA interferase family)